MSLLTTVLRCCPKTLSAAAAVRTTAGFVTACCNMLYPISRQFCRVENVHWTRHTSHTEVSMKWSHILRVSLSHLLYSLNYIEMIELLEHVWLTKLIWFESQEKAKDEEGGKLALPALPAKRIFQNASGNMARIILNPQHLDSKKFHCDCQKNFDIYWLNQDLPLPYNYPNYSVKSALR